LHSVSIKNLFVRLSSSYSFTIAQNKQYLCIISDGSSCAIFVVSKKQSIAPGYATIFNNNTNNFKCEIQGDTIYLKSTNYGAMITAVCFH
jgi:hypothetical protein